MWKEFFFVCSILFLYHLRVISFLMVHDKLLSFECLFDFKTWRVLLNRREKFFRDFVHEQQQHRRSWFNTKMAFILFFITWIIGHLPKSLLERQQDEMKLTYTSSDFTFVYNSFTWTRERKTKIKNKMAVFREKLVEENFSSWNFSLMFITAAGCGTWRQITQRWIIESRCFLWWLLVYHIQIILAKDGKAKAKEKATQSNSLRKMIFFRFFLSFSSLSSRKEKKEENSKWKFFWENAKTWNDFS